MRRLKWKIRKGSGSTEVGGESCRAARMRPVLNKTKTAWSSLKYRVGVRR